MDWRGVRELGVGVGMGSTPGTPPISRHSSGIELIPQPHGGALLAKGVPGHVGAGGRPAEKVRKDATESLEQHVSRIGRLMGETVRLAEEEIGSEKLNVTNLAALLNQVSKLANTLTSIGPGTKVTNVLQNPDVEDRCVRAFDAWQESGDGTRLGFLKTLAEALKE